MEIVGAKIYHCLNCLIQRFLSQFEEMFASPPPWDVVREYQPCRLTIYFEGFDRSKLHPVNPEVTLGEILKSGRLAFSSS